MSGAVRTATVSGDWDAGSTWSGNTIPTCGDSVIVPLGITVTVDDHEDYSSCGTKMVVVVRGRFFFQSGKKLQFSCASRVYVIGTGSIVPGGGGGSSNLIEICDTVVWKAADGTRSGPWCYPIDSYACSAFLPVTLKYFAGSMCGDSVCIEWATGVEEKNDYFELERSVDGTAFTTVSRIYSQTRGVTSAAGYRYHATYYEPSDGYYYFRLKQVDVDGTSSYGPVIVVRAALPPHESIRMFPTPSDGTVCFRFAASGQAEQGALRVTSASGAVVLATSWSSSSGLVVLDTGLKSGVYSCTFERRGQLHFFRIAIR